ncbi:MAG: phosphatidylglycerophosphatase A [Gammaproteobacteria bacterium]|nr:phosphatidylglycerophosphatase A [Gammaproteobacteria bacterium]
MNNREVLTHPIHFLAFGLGSGLAPVAPGTFGTGVGVLLYIPLAQLPLPYYTALLLVSFGIGIWLCGTTARHLGVHDHGGIVWDEMVGFWITMTAAPPGWGWVLAGFVLFRIFDITKPWPINLADKRVPGGLGIMLDDLMAGLYAALCLQIGYFGMLQV